MVIPCFNLIYMESMIPEDLKEIPGFPGYYINSNGEVYSNRHHNNLAKMVLKEDKDGYLEVGLYKNGKRYFRRVHRLVLEAFALNPNKLTQVNHKDGNKKNNNINNLEWCTCQDNLLHSFRVLHRAPSITTNRKVSLENKDTKEIRKFISVKECAKFLGMSYEHLLKLLNGTKDITKSRKLRSYNIEFEV
jgi:predicted O-linked N-acetylglucosamine transferase (SPINDLY family)